MFSIPLDKVVNPFRLLPPVNLFGGCNEKIADNTEEDISTLSSDRDSDIKCQYFQSSFARSLSQNSDSSNMNQFQSQNSKKNNRLSNGQARKSLNVNNGARSFETWPLADGETVPPIPARRQNVETSTIVPTASAVTGAAGLLRSNTCGNVNRVITDNGIGNSINTGCRKPQQVSNSDRCNGSGNNFIRKNINTCWPPQSGITATTGEQEYQLLDDTVQEMKAKAGDFTDNQFDPVDATTNVEVIFLQNQVDTLQWQLKQIESNCEMQRAILEEVARFFERFQENFANKEIEQISRSKSMYHVYGDPDIGVESNKTSAYQRTRSNTNLADLKRTPLLLGDNRKTDIVDHCDISSSNNAYHSFKDYTWRRSPKKRGGPKLSPTDQAEEKLNQEAFRLSRVINNLLSIKQTDLTSISQNLSQRIKPLPAENIVTNPVIAQKPNLSTDMLFLRNMNVRDSRLSLRSNTDSSIHSTSSSSKLETDEENYSSPLLGKQCTTICSTEDESGFSSISSFHDMGVALNSTMISDVSAPSPHLNNAVGYHDFSLDSRNSTLKPGIVTASVPPASNVGVIPVHSDLANRWDSTKTYRNNKTHKFSTLSSNDSTTVLWV